VCKVNFNISKLNGFESKAVIPTFEAFNNDTTGSYLSEWFIFIYCWVILQKMGWFENKPHLLISMCDKISVPAIFSDH